ncbi:MAG: serine/threonine-protein kinase [Polyangiaceae bacterium]
MPTSRAPLRPLPLRARRARAAPSPLSPHPDLQARAAPSPPLLLAHRARAVPSRLSPHRAPPAPAALSPRSRLPVQQRAQHQDPPPHAPRPLSPRPPRRPHRPPRRPLNPHRPLNPPRSHNPRSPPPAPPRKTSTRSPSKTSPTSAPPSRITARNSTIFSRPCPCSPRPPSPPPWAGPRRQTPRPAPRAPPPASPARAPQRPQHRLRPRRPPRRSPRASPSTAYPPPPAPCPPPWARCSPPPDPAAPAVDPDPSPYGPGSIIGDKYRLIQVIGRGGMGAVWIAHNTALDVEVAIKLMRRDRATPEAAARFSTEARAAAKLGHPSIVRVFDFGETHRGDPFIVMELLRGESFGALLTRKKRLASTIAVQTLLPVAHALSAAHAKGIVHRDLKPDNILLAKDESGVVTPKVVDFGIAKLVTADVDRHFTIAGEVLGSPDYMSPEQARGEDDIDHRSDIWTFSVLLYEAIGGKRPFDGANYNALLAAIIASRPTPLTDLGVADPVLWSIVEKGLAKERDARWQSVREIGIELSRWAIDHGAEHDLVGASLAAQWLEPTRKRLFTVAGSATPNLDAAVPPTDPQIPKPPPLGNLAAEVPKPATAPATTNTLPPFVPRRRPWIALLLIALLAAVVVLLLSWGSLFDPPPEPASSGSAPSASTLAPSPPPSTSSATSSSASSADPATTTTAPKPPPATTTTATKTKPSPWVKPRAPQVKGDIKF